MLKGDLTREAILETAMAKASTYGLEALTLGDLATACGLSKSGIFNHFDSKEALQLAILERAVVRFRRAVVAPAFERPPGPERLRALMSGYLDWIEGDGRREGCVFVTAVDEAPRQTESVRARVARSQANWRETLSGVIAGCVAGEAEVDAAVFEALGAALAYQNQLRLTGARTARPLADRVVESLVARLSAPPTDDADSNVARRSA